MADINSEQSVILRWNRSFELQSYPLRSILERDCCGERIVSVNISKADSGTVATVTLRDLSTASKLVEVLKFNAEYFRSLSPESPCVILEPNSKLDKTKVPVRRVLALNIEKELSDDELIRSATNLLTKNSGVNSSHQVTCVCRSLARRTAALETNKDLLLKECLVTPAFKLSARYDESRRKIQVFNALTVSPKEGNTELELKNVKSKLEALTGRQFLHAYASLELPTIAILEYSADALPNPSVNDGGKDAEAPSEKLLVFEYDDLVGVSLPQRFKAVQPSQQGAQQRVTVTVTFRVSLRELVEDEDVAQLLELHRAEAEKLCAKLGRTAHFTVAFEAAKAQAELQLQTDSHFIVTLCFDDGTSNQAAKSQSSGPFEIGPLDSKSPHFSLIDHRDAARRQIEGVIRSRFGSGVKLPFPKLSYYQFLDKHLPQSDFLKQVNDNGCVAVFNCRRLDVPENITLVGRSSSKLMSAAKSRLQHLKDSYIELVNSQNTGLLSGIRSFFRAPQEYSLDKDASVTQSDRTVCLRINSLSETELALLIESGALRAVINEKCNSLVSASYRQPLSLSHGETCVLRLRGSLQNVLFAAQEVRRVLIASASIYRIVNVGTRHAGVLLNGAVIKLICSEKGRRALTDKLKLDDTLLTYGVDAKTASPSITFRASQINQNALDNTIHLIAGAWITVFHVGPVVNSQLRLLDTTKWSCLLDNLRWRARENFPLYFAAANLNGDNRSQLSFASLFFEVKKIEKDVKEFFDQHRVLTDADVPISAVYADALRTFPKLQQQFESLQVAINNNNDTCLRFRAVVVDVLQPGSPSSSRAALRVNGCSCDWTVFEQQFNSLCSSSLKQEVARDQPGLRTLLSQRENVQFITDLENSLLCLVFLLPSTATTATAATTGNQVQLAALQSAERCSRLVAQSRTVAAAGVQNESHQLPTPLFEADLCGISFCVAQSGIDDYPHELRVVFVDSPNDTLRFESANDGQLFLAYLDANASLNGLDSARRTFVTLLHVAEANELDSISFAMITLANIPSSRRRSVADASLLLAQRIIDAVQNASETDQLTAFDSLKRIALVSPNSADVVNARLAVQKSLAHPLVVKTERGGMRSALFNEGVAAAPSFPSPVLANTPPLQLQPPTPSPYAVQLRVVRGDIVQEQVDIIVNSTNESLSMTGMVGKLLIKHGGQQLEEAIRSTARLNNGIAVTSGRFGALKCKHIVHVCSPESAATCRDLVRRCVLKAEELRGTSIAIPAIGTGVKALDRDAIAPAIIEGALSSNTKMEVRIVLYDEPTYQLFQKALLARTASSASTPAPPILAPTLVPAPSAMVMASKKETRVESVKLPKQSGARFYQPATLLVVAQEEQVCRDAITRVKDRLRQEPLVTVREGEKQARNMLNLDRSILNWFARRNQVDVLEWNVAAEQVELSGQQQQLANFRTEVFEVIIDFNERRNARELQRAVRWEYAEQAGVGVVPGVKPNKKLMFLPFDVMTNASIEKAHKNGKDTVEYDRHNDDCTTNRYCIDFKTKVESLKSNPSTQRSRRVRRVDMTRARSHKQVDLPVEWELSSDDESDVESGASGKPPTLLKVLELQSGTSEYIKIEMEFRKQLPNVRVLRIERIQNVTLYRQYIAQKQRMEAKYSSLARAKPVEIESLLYHGTKEDVVVKVEQHGFDRGYAGQNVGAVWGHGVYFSSKISYSAQNSYAVPNGRGEQHIFVCAVLIGETVVGNGNMKVLPANPKSNVPNDIYDTATDNQTPPIIYVKFHDAHVYPKYLVKFKP